MFLSFLLSRIYASYLRKQQKRYYRHNALLLPLYFEYVFFPNARLLEY